MIAPKIAPLSFIRLYQSWAAQSGALTLFLLFLLIALWFFPLSGSESYGTLQEVTSVALVLNAFFGLFFGNWAHDGGESPTAFIHLTYYLNSIIVFALALSLLLAIIMPHS